MMGEKSALSFPKDYQSLYDKIMLGIFIFFRQFPVVYISLILAVKN